VEQRDLSAEILAKNIAALLFEKNKLVRMSKAARTAQPQDSEKRMLDILAHWLEVPA